VLDALGVVEPIHGEQQPPVAAQLLAELLGPLLDMRVGGELLDLGNVDGYRERACGDRAAVHDDMVAFGFQPEQAAGQAQKVLRREGFLEADQVGAEHRGHELELVVVYPDEGAGCREFGGGRREALVHRDVRLQPVPVNAGVSTASWYGGQIVAFDSPS
jgi:hypothetical protein